MCDCRSQLEHQLLERFKEKAPEATNHRAALTGFVLLFDPKKVISKGAMPLELTATYPQKNGGVKRRTTKQQMIFSFCPFCGEPYPSSKEAAE
jgi:hypothetical protein